MPCRTDICEDYDEAEIKRLQTELDRLTQFLCKICTVLEQPITVGNSSLYGGTLIPTEVMEWWIKHKEFDIKRLAEVRKRALSKLTDEEKEALELPCQ